MRSARCGPPEHALAVLLGTSSRTSSPNTRSTSGSARSRSVASSASAACNLAAASPEDSPCVCPSGPPISAWLDPGPWPRPTTTSSITPTTDRRGQRKRRRESPGSASCSATHPSDYVRALLEPVPASSVAGTYLFPQLGEGTRRTITVVLRFAWLRPTHTRNALDPRSVRENGGFEVAPKNFCTSA